MNGLPKDPDAFLAEPEGAAVPFVLESLEIIDAHVHLFPPRLFEAIWRWFDRHAWKIRYRLHAEQVVEFLLARGVKRLVALHYAHKPGMARDLNRFVAEIARAHPEVIALATVFPGEPDAREVLREAFGPLGLRGVKIHCHVQKLGADDPRLEEVYAACEDAGRPVVIHAGREPSSEAYGLDTRALCAADQIERVVRRHPRLRLVVPHLGADEFEAYGALLDRHEHLWLDTTMAIAGYLQGSPPASVFPARAARMLYGTDFPNIPYAWDRELKRIAAVGLAPEVLAKLLSGNALGLFGS
jgi:hypothetical protein